MHPRFCYVERQDGLRVMKLKDLQGSDTGLIARIISAYAWRNHKKRKPAQNNQRLAEV
jgi:hypothetical protein